MTTNSDKQNFKELLEWIEDGWYDNYIPQIIKALKERQTSAIEVGAKVIVNNVDETSRSQYNINGCEAIVEKVNAKSITVRLTKLSAIAKKNKVASVGGRWQLSPTFVSIA